MGCGSSSPAEVQPADSAGGQGAKGNFKGGFLSRRRVATTPQLEARLKEALRLIIADRERREKTGETSTAASFNRIILKFPAIRVRGGEKGREEERGRRESEEKRKGRLPRTASSPSPLRLFRIPT